MSLYERVSRHCVLGLALLLGMAAWAQATPRTWNGSVDSDWFNSANWTPSDNWPQGGDAVSVNGGSILLTNSTATLGSFSITTATVIFTNWDSALQATVVTIQNGGVLTHVQCNTNAAPANTNRVCILCSNLTITAGGSINVNENGFVGGVQANGQGPGGAKYMNAYSAGGGYGSRGGDSDNGGGDGGQTYGLPTTPSAPGSGGVCGAGPGPGGAGGGAVWIEADGEVAVDGMISANGQNGPDYWTGGGSGGGVYIACNSINGTGGAITANGGHRGHDGDAHTGGGGGGRIAIHYNVTAERNITPRPALEISAAGREKTTAPGTLDLTETYLLPELYGAASIHDVSLSGFSSWSPNSLTVTNAWLMFSVSNFVLTVTNDMRIAGSTGRIDVVDNPVVVVGGSLFMDGGAMHLYSGATNGGTTNYGGRMAVSGSITLGPSSWIYPHSHPTNGGSMVFQAQNLTIATNAGFNADGLGFQALINTNNHGLNGQGPGGPMWSSAYSAGAGYGGKGGQNSTANDGGPTYGNSNAPVDAGSSGVVGQNQAYGHGGGVVRIEANDSVQVDGTITANGAAAGDGQFGGGGSGGSVFIKCRRFKGGSNGILQAKGGDSGTGGPENGSGGGGRIAVWRSSDVYAGTTSVTGGVAAASSQEGEVGTVVWVDIPVVGTVIMIR